MEKVEISRDSLIALLDLAAYEYKNQRMSDKELWQALVDAARAVYPDSFGQYLQDTGHI